MIPEDKKNTCTHVEFVSHDGYSNSIALKHLHEDCIFAFSMNGENLTADHGFPMRAVLPGIIGAKWVKAILEVNFLDGPGDSPWAANYYKIDGEPCVEFGLTSIITDVVGTKVEGIAWGVGVEIEEVRICKPNQFDDYRSAEIIRGDVESDNVRAWGWVRWTAEVDDFEGEICAYCIDKEGKVQPLQVEDVWNWNGYLNNSPHIYMNETNNPLRFRPVAWRSV